ncbi:hypothetical protein Pure05_05540 [Paenarthrobacter ureafaciens]|nr:hypothetical protein Pure01_02050 [Paenarthrobacter ureafaciens]GLU75114.1 hypothetical protein Pure05_05540 [Paenarthrobacter ureafaciens]
MSTATMNAGTFVVNSREVQMDHHSPAFKPSRVTPAIGSKDSGGPESILPDNAATVRKTATTNKVNGVDCTCLTA